MEKSLEARLEKYPDLRARFEDMLELVENTDGALIRADDAEECVLEKMQKIGHQALTSWAVTQEQRLSQQTLFKKGTTVNESKTSDGIRE